MRWFTTPAHKPLSISANSLLRTLYAQTKDNPNTGMDKETFAKIANFLPEELDGPLSELEGHSYVWNGTERVGLTQMGRSRCADVVTRLRTAPPRHTP
jgi:hypothetical protein